MRSRTVLVIRARGRCGFALDEFGVDFDGGAFVVVGDGACDAVDDEFGCEAADFLGFLPHCGEGRVHCFGEVEVGEANDVKVARNRQFQFFGGLLDELRFVVVDGEDGGEGHCFHRA